MDTVRLQYLDKLIDWAEEWQMMFNVSKCQVMHFDKKDYNNTDYYMNGQRLLTVTEEKELGVVISSNMKLSQQRIQAYSKTSRILAMINHTILYKILGNLVRLYKSLAYCTAVWSPHCVKDKVC